jgi:hypothetical protein
VATIRITSESSRAEIDEALEVARRRRVLTELPTVYVEMSELIDRLLDRRLKAPDAPT